MCLTKLILSVIIAFIKYCTKFNNIIFALAFSNLPNTQSEIICICALALAFIYSYREFRKENSNQYHYFKVSLNS